jgi:hypothetical protein
MRDLQVCRFPRSAVLLHRQTGTDQLDLAWRHMSCAHGQTSSFVRHSEANHLEADRPRGQSDRRRQRGCIDLFCTIRADGKGHYVVKPSLR